MSVDGLRFVAETPLMHFITYMYTLPNKSYDLVKSIPQFYPWLKYTETYSQLKQWNKKFRGSKFFEFKQLDIENFKDLRICYLEDLKVWMFEILKI